MKIQTQSILILSAFICMAGAAPKATAVVPMPDGCYPGYTTAEGCNALNFLTSGLGNTGVGWYSLYVDTTGNFNTGVGGGALALNNADSNTAVGAGAMLLNTTGVQNVAVGTDALVFNDSGGSNTAVGNKALFDNVDGFFNTAVGDGALFANTGGSENTVVGTAAIGNNPPGNHNTVVGSFAALNTTSDENTVVGAAALGTNTSGGGNTAVGNAALFSSTGNYNIALGANAGGNVTTASNVICIGDIGANVSNSCFIGYIRGVTTVNNDAIPVVIDSAGQLGTMSSSRRFKKDIEPMKKTSEAILALKPVTFHYKSDKMNRSEFGLIAEEVAKVNPDLVVRDRKGEIYTVRYDAVNAMLLNEFLKEHSTVEQQKASIAELRSVVATQQKEFQAAIAEQRKEFEARLQEQDAKIQRVNDRVELNRTDRQNLATND